MWPTYPAAVVLGHEGQRQAIMARWGLIASTTRAFNARLSTFNARSESMATSPTFGGAWAKGQRCIVAADAIFEPDWRSGRHVPTRLQRADGEPLGIAGLWDRWTAPGGEVIFSFTMLTINAGSHTLMKHMHKPLDEKRMLVFLRPCHYDRWLNAPPPTAAAAAEYAELLVPLPADQLMATPEPGPDVQNNPTLF